MNKKSCVFVLIAVLNASNAKADTSHMIDAVFNTFAWIAYIGTFTSWFMLYIIITGNKQKLILGILIISIICWLIGAEAIRVGRDLSTFPDSYEDAQNFTIWGWVIIILNILPLVIPILRSASKYNPPIDKVYEKKIENSTNNNK